MNLIILPITESQIHEMFSWRYTPPYDIYNLDPGPEKQKETIIYFLDPEICAHAILEESGELVAFCTFGRDATVPGGDYSAEALDIGLGVRPDLTGKGLGSKFVQAVIKFAQDSFDPPTLRVTIAEFNRRAQRVWEGQGFTRQLT